MTQLYLATAYRWGNLNGDQYHVYGGADREKALELAEIEAQDRGGKYGVEVREFSEDGIDSKAIGYFLSSMDDDTSDGPIYNHRIDFHERLGSFVSQYASGKVLLPDPHDEHVMKYTEVTPDPIVVAEVQRQRAVMEAIAGSNLKEMRELRDGR